LRQASTPTTGLARTVRLSDGRSIGFSAAGPHDGYPVVYCHGAIGSPRWRIPALESELERIGIRYIVVDRPGFGGSDPSPERSVAAFACDLGEVMTVLRYERFSVVGVSAGAPYALGCGWALPGRVGAVAAVSPLVPADGAGASPSFRYRLPLIPYGSARLGPAFAALCLRALRLHGQTSADAMIDDYLVCRRAWGFDPGAVRVPVTVWHGGADRLVPVAHALVLASAIPGCTTCIEPHGGHFFYSGRLAQVLASLVPGLPRVEETEPALLSAA
jgi:pimeloyl-ACP methyl ester carboxylesterase